MKLKKFVASDVQKAMLKVYEVLGPDALIYSTNSTPNGVEIHAGLEGDTTQADDTFVEEFHSNSTKVATASFDQRSVADLNQQIHMLEEKVKQLSSFIENKFLHQFYKTDDESLVQKNLLFFHLNKLGFKGGFAQQFIQDCIMSRHITDKMDEAEIEKALISYIKTDNSECIDEAGVFSIIGPTGIGKTTTIAKLASRYATRYGAASVGMITTDHHDVFNKNQLLNFSEKEGIDLEYANNPRELAAALQTMQGKRIILLDTYGVNQKDPSKIAKLNELLEKQKVKITTLLALPCNVQENILDEIVQAFTTQSLRGVILTKQDESTSINAALSTCMKFKLKIAYLTNGQNIKSDIHKLTPEEVYSLITTNVLPIPANNEQTVEKRSLLNKLTRKKAAYELGE